MRVWQHQCRSLWLLKPVNLLAQVKDMRQSGVTPKLRTFTPALTAYCDSHNLNSVRGSDTLSSTQFNSS